jgi:transposase
MAQSQPRQGIPTEVSKEQFEQFILPHLSKGSRGPETTLSFHAIFNYILYVLYLGCRWKHLPIEKDRHGRREIHSTSIYRTFRRWQAEGCFDATFEGSVLKLHQDNRLDLSVIHGDGTTTAAKKGGDNIGYSGHKKVKGDKAVVFCDRHCNVIAPLVAAAGNRNESPLLRQALPQLTKIARALELDLQGSIMSLDGGTTARTIAKPSSIVEWFPTSIRTRAAESIPSEVESRCSSSHLRRTVPYHRAAVCLRR